jgi:FkbM family methyltransferase
MLRSVLPHGLARFHDWKARFERIGAPGSHAWNESSRQALLKSRIELLPPILWSDLNCVLDVGANLGDWTASLLEFCQVNTLHAFEPNPHLAANLNNRFARHSRLKQFVLHQAAVGNDSSQVTFNITAGSALSSVLQPNSTCQQLYTKESAIVERVTVPQVRLDDAVPGDQIIDVYKLDVQGYERAALAGSVETLKRTKAILLETHFVSHYEQDDNIASLFDLMCKTYGFVFHDMSACERDSHGRATWADCCFINPKLVPVGR